VNEKLRTVDLGFDRFRAQLLAAACENDGLHVELLIMDDNGVAPGYTDLTPHKLLVRADDVERVGEVLTASGFPGPYDIT